MAFAISKLLDDETPHSSQVDGVRGRWKKEVGIGPHNSIYLGPQNTFIGLCAK